LTWVQVEARKVGFTIIFAKSDNEGNEKKIYAFVKCDCPFRFIGFFFSVSEWRLIVGAKNITMR